MTTLNETIQSAIKVNKVIIGYRRSIRLIKTGSPKLIVIANNLPKKMKDEIEHNAKVGSVQVEIFNSSSKELGVVCGKPFPVSTLVIKR